MRLKIQIMMEFSGTPNMVSYVEKYPWKGMLWIWAAKLAKGCICKLYPWDTISSVVNVFSLNIL